MISTVVSIIGGSTLALFSVHTGGAIGWAGLFLGTLIALSGIALKGQQT